MKRPPLIASFRHAWRGLLLGFKTERSFRLQVAVAVLVIIAIFVLPLSRIEQLLLLVVTMFVLVLELLNSSVERLVDLTKPRLDEYAREVKDLMAGAVLLAVLFVCVIGLMIFWPYLFALFQSV